MKNINTLKDIITIFTSNLILLLSSIIVAFVFPKITSLSDFGYYKTFTLYISYIGLLHFGFCDGIYLKYAGKSTTELKDGKFRFFSLFIIGMEILISFFIVLFSAFFASEDMKFLFYALAIYSFFHICSSYCRLALEATSQFKTSSVRIVVCSLLRVLGAGVFWFYSIKFSSLISYQLLVAFTIILELILTICLFSSFIEDLLENATTVFDSMSEIPGVFRLGLPLLITNLSTTLLLVIDRQFVNIFFPKNEYAIYAFAYSLLALVTTTTSAIATVLFPKLKNTAVEDLRNNYSNLIAAILVVVFAGLIVYFPLSGFIKWYLPKYIDSLVIFRIIFPGLAISSAITVVMYNYYKALNATTHFLKISLFVILFSTLANYIAYIKFHTTWSISVASVFIMLFWYIIAENFFIKIFAIKWLKNFSYLFLMMIIFYIITFNMNEYFGFLTYFLIFILLTFLFYKNFLSDFKTWKNKCK